MPITNKIQSAGNSLAASAGSPQAQALQPQQLQIVPPIGSQASVMKPPPVPQGGLDPQIVAVAQAIRNVESQGNYNAVGDNGASLGAYQWNNGGKPVEPGQTPINWQNAAKQYLGSADAPMTPENQNYVAYQQIAAYKAQGLTPSSIDALWNGARPDPNNPGQYVHINSQRASAFNQALQNIVSGNAQANPQQPNPNGLPNGGNDANNTQNDPGLINDVKSGNILGAAKDVGNFAFPIVSDLANDFQGSNSKSTLQQLGDLGMSALWFLPFGDLAEGATDVARAGLGLTEGSEETANALAEAENTPETITNAAETASKGKLASTLGNVATGLGVGYGANVASNLAQGQTGAQALKPGLQTAVGGSLPVAAEGLGGIYNKLFGQQSMLDQVQQAYEDAAGSTKSGIKGMSKTSSRGLDPNPEFLANAGILPETEEINGRRVFTTGENSVSQQTLQGRANDLTTLRDAAISKAGTSIPVGLEDMRTQALNEADDQFAGTALATVQKHINDEFDAYKSQFGDGQGNISLTEANEIKMDLQGKTKYDATRPTIISQANGMMAKVAQSTVEDTAEKAGLPGVKALNKIIAQHLDAMKFLSKLDGQTVKGGKIGKYIDEIVGGSIGNAVGTGVGGALGSPTIGAGVGTLAGVGAGKLFSKFVQKFASGGAVSAAAIGRMAAQDPEVVQQFLQYLGDEAPFESGSKIAPVIEAEQKSAPDLVKSSLSNIPAQAILDALKNGYSVKEIEDYINSESNQAVGT